MARRNIKQLETALGYRFKSRAVLDRAGAGYIAPGDYPMELLVMILVPQWP